jgi:hypothetical protein
MDLFKKILEKKFSEISVKNFEITWYKFYLIPT